MIVTTNIKRCFDNYMRIYGDKYPPLKKLDLECMLGISYKLCSPKLYQIYDAIGDIIPDEENEFIAYKDFLKEIYGMEHDFIELGGGPYPNIGVYISREQKLINRGTVTVYDPTLVAIDIEGVILKPEEFLYSPLIQSPIGNNNILYGRLSCKVYETGINAANHQNVPFCFHICSCYKKADMSDDAYINGIYQSAKSTLPNGLEIGIDYLPKQFQQIPIIYSKRK